ncbi:MAG: hypothetical protein IJA85_04825 [Clostridia bacterium]|nr:hypothetical protein [Clostridia bacterium]
MDLKYLKKIGIYIVSAIISLLLIAYILYHFIGSFSKEVEYTPAVVFTQNETVALDIYIMRSEQVLYSASPGEVSRIYEDGTKVAVNTVVANIYGGGTSSISSSIMALDNKISILEDSNMEDGMSVYDTAAIDSRIDELYYTILDKTASGDLEYALRKKDELLTQLNKRQIIVNKVTSYNDRILSLENQKLSLTSQLDSITATVKTTGSGYFYGTVDGYENIFSASRVDDMTIADFDEMINSKPDDTLTDGSRGESVGKLVTDFTWYAACKVQKDMLRYFTEGSSYRIVFPFSSDTELTMKLYRVISQTDRDDVVLIFSCGSLPDNFNFLRMQSVYLVKESYTGYKVPVSAVRMVDGVQGVYVLDGNVVRFKKIDALFESDGYLIVAEQDILHDEAYALKLGLYDMIITKGRGMYEGKIVD